MKIENVFAMHLSGVLEKMTYREGIKVLEGLFSEIVYIAIRFRKLEETNGYKYGYECNFIVTNAWWDILDKVYNEHFRIEEHNILKRHGIQSVSCRLYLNPTSEEMLEYLGVDETSEEDIVNEFEEYFFDNGCEEIDECIFEYVDDITIAWDVIVDEKGHYYRGGESKLNQHKEYKGIWRDWSLADVGNNVL